MNTATDDFEKIVARVKQQLASLKEECSRYEQKHARSEWPKYLKSIQKSTFEQLDDNFDDLWTHFEGVSSDIWDKQKKHMEKELFTLFYDGIETNMHIRNKPLGFSGDYITMNFIYDSSNGTWLGETIYGQLMNRYACSIDVSRSNLSRKECLKGKILQYLKSEKDATILSVGCGPAREIFELMDADAFKEPVDIYLIDLDQHALDYIDSRLKETVYDREKIRIRVHQIDLASIVMNNGLRTLFGKVGFVYASGMFDYFADKTAQRAFSRLAEIATDELVVFNISLEGARHRAYYEILGEWKMYHRSEREMRQLTKGFSEEADILLERYENCKSYWILDVTKKNG